MPELDPDERESILEELEDLGALRELFEPRGFRGVMITCADCGEDHYYDWDLLKESLEHMLETGEPRMHEPPFEPDADSYIAWEYGRGYLDAKAESDRSETEAPPTDEVPATTWLEERTRCPYCRGRLGAKAFEEWGYCPFCGISLAPLRLADALHARGLSEEEIIELLDSCGFEPPPPPGEVF
jgi:hypothetical protein